MLYCTVDHLAEHVALVRDADVGRDVADHQAVAADETEHARNVLIFLREVEFAISLEVFEIVGTQWTTLMS